MTVLTMIQGAYALLGVGDFGDQVTSLLRHSPHLPAVVAGNVREAFEMSSKAVVTAMWRPCPAICEEADALAFEHGRPWLPVILDSAMVRVGPVVVPGSSACFACFTARCVQHDVQRTITRALHAAYDRDPDFGCQGYLDHHARLAAALAGHALGQLDCGRLPAKDGQVLSFSLHHARVRHHHVIARGSCPRCSRPAPAVPLEAEYVH